MLVRGCLCKPIFSNSYIRICIRNERVGEGWRKGKKNIEQIAGGSGEEIHR